MADNTDKVFALTYLLEFRFASRKVILSKKNRHVQPEYNQDLYKDRHLVECFLNKVKHYRRLATRYDKLACTFKAFLTFASIMIWPA